MTILRDQGQQGLGQDFVETGRFEQIIQWLDLAGSHVCGNGFLSGMGLPGIGCIIGSQAGGENGFGVRTSAAGDGCIDEFDVRIFLVEDFDHGGQAVRFTWADPPGEYFNFRTGGGCRGFRSASREHKHGNHQEAE